MLVQKRQYENLLVGMMFFTFGFVFMDRLSIVFLFPFIGPALHLNNAEIGMIVSILSITWAISGWFFGSFSDHLRRKRAFLIPITLFFSITSILSGLVNSFYTMVIVRGLMGLGEGPILPIAQAAVSEASTPKRRGFNLGFVQSASGLLGATIAPIVVTDIAATSSWRNAFYLLAVPGILMTLVLWRFMKKEDAHLQADHTHVRLPYATVFTHRNVWLSTVISGAFMTWLFVLTTFAPLYLIKVDHFTIPQMGLIMSAMGFGSFIWGFFVPYLSDHFGRKITLILFSFISCLSPLALLTIHSTVTIMMLVGFFANVGQGCFPLFMAIIPAESVNPTQAATAISLSQGAGELVGGALLPTLAGAAADTFGLSAPLWIAAAGALCAAVVSMALIETAPRHVQVEPNKNLA